ncbi:glycosyltransferase [Thalassobellus sediminis]|uniref:glycosyltransferase n=1 Tax=Thalassobellus sediminis TaxID=3367753 RepID=UPI0037956E24
MKIGIIIIFHNNAFSIDSKLHKEFLDLKNVTHLCLVNNASTDKTLEKLQQLNDASEHVYTIIDIKQNKGNEAAIKAGVRYLFNQKDLNYIGFINFEEGKTLRYLFEFLRTFEKPSNLIKQYNLEQVKNNKKQRTLFKNIVSVVDYLNQKHIGVSEEIKRIS